MLAEPRFVAAQRALQNLELAQHRRGELLVRQRALLDAAPDSAELWYLWGRLLTSTDAQRRAFETARRLDSRCPWPWLGLGAIDLAADDVERAIGELRHGRELAPDLRELELGLVRALLADPKQLGEAERLLGGVLDAEPWDVARVLLLADLRVRQERPREAIEILGRLLARVPKNGEVAATLLQRLERDGTVEDAAWIERELEATAREPILIALLARCHAMRGDARGAIAAWSSLAELTAEERGWRRLLRVLGGQLREAMDEESPRFDALARIGARTPAWHELEQLLQPADDGAATDGAAPDPGAIADALARMGWIEEAIAVLRPGVRAGAASEQENRLVIALLGQRQLEAELKVLALETYRDFAAGRPTPDLDHVLARAGAAAERAVGEDLLAGTRVLSFWPVGSLVDPTTAGGLPGYFRDHGRLFVAGQRSGCPPEIMLASIVGAGTAGPQEAQLSFVEGTLIPSWLEHEGARFAGAALDRFAYVDVAAVEDDVARLFALEREIGPEKARVLADPVLARARPCGARRRRRARRGGDQARAARARRLAGARLVERPLGVPGRGSRRRARARDRPSRGCAALPAALDHIWSHVGDLLRLHFSPRRIEEWLEMRAQCIALARARNPYLVLGASVGQLGGGRTITPHGGGYQELLTRLVEVLDDSPDDFPELDRSCVLVQQLDRLSPDEIRLAARRVLADLGIE